MWSPLKASWNILAIAGASWTVARCKEYAMSQSLNGGYGHETTYNLDSFHVGAF